MNITQIVGAITMKMEYFNISYKKFPKSNTKKKDSPKFKTAELSTMPSAAKHFYVRTYRRQNVQLSKK